MYAKLEIEKEKFLLALNFAFQNFKPMHKSWLVTDDTPPVSPASSNALQNTL
jgi:hypothetical protein